MARGEDVTGASDVVGGSRGWRDVVAVLDDRARESHLKEVTALAVPVAFRYGRQVALWSWHLEARVTDGRREGIGLVPGYGPSPVSALKLGERLVGAGPIDRYGVAHDRTVTAAIDTALCDLVGAERLGLAAGAVGLEGMIWFRRRSGAVERQARGLHKRGFRAVKVKLSGQRNADLRAVRAVLGVFPAAAVRVDANRGYRSVADAVALCESLVALGIEWIEEPTAAVEDWLRISDETGIRVIGDESLAADADVERALERRCVHGVNIKLARIGGPVQALRLVERCREVGVDTFVGCSEDLGSGMAAVLHVAAATTSRQAEGWGAQRLGLEGADAVVGGLSDGRATEWSPLGDVAPLTTAGSRRMLRVGTDARSRAVALAFRVGQAAIGRSLSALTEIGGPRKQASEQGRIDILSPELGWQAAPNLGGSRYEAVAARVLRASGRTRLLLPESQASGWPRGAHCGRLWLPRGNRAAVLAAYGPFQLLTEVLRRRPEVLRLHSISHLGVPGIVAAAAARRLGWHGSTVAHVHHVEEDGSLEHPRRRLARKIDSVVVASVDRIIVPSEATRSSLVRRYPVTERVVRVVPNALPEAPSLRPPRADEELRLAFIGSFVERKRPLLFVDICRDVARTRQVTACMVGSGPLLDRVRAEAADLPIDIQEPMHDIEPVFEWADAVVCTSRVEGFYLVGLEALQRGRPVFGFAIPALRELLGEGLTRCLAPTGDTAALVEILQELGPDDIRQLGDAASRRSRHYDLASFSRKLHAALLPEGGGPPGVPVATNDHGASRC